MASVATNPRMKIGPSYWDAEPPEDTGSSLELISSSAIELIEEARLVESPVEASFFTEPTEGPKHERLPWLLFALAVAIMLWAASEVVAPRFRALEAAEARLDRLSAVAAANRAIETKLSAIQAENADLLAQSELWEAAVSAEVEADAALRARLEAAFQAEPRVEIFRADERYGLRISADELFTSGADLGETGLLDVVTGAVAGHEVTVVGHSDADPIPRRLQAKFPTSWELSAARASAVARHLETRGLTGLVVEARAATQPLPGAPKNRQRRIEILIR